MEAFLWLFNCTVSAYVEILESFAWQKPYWFFFFYFFWHILFLCCHFIFPPTFSNFIFPQFVNIHFYFPIWLCFFWGGGVFTLTNRYIGISLFHCLFYFFCRMSVHFLSKLVDWCLLIRIILSAKCLSLSTIYLTHYR